MVMRQNEHLLAPAAEDREFIGRCREVLGKHGRSFHWASLILPKDVRDDAALAYAFCRLVDDSADEATTLEVANEQLLEIEDMLRGRRARTALVEAFVLMCERRRIAMTPALDLIAGARSDLTSVRVDSDQTLGLYCYRVAGTVGLLMCGILGVRESEAMRRAVHLGMAMQLTNICRDVLEDLERDRIYLPESRLMRLGLSQHEICLVIRDGQGTPQAVREISNKLASSVRELLNEADLLYESGRQGMRYLQGRVRLAVMVAGVLYREVGVRLRDQRGGDALRGRVVVPVWRKWVLTLGELFSFLSGGPKRICLDDVKELG